ncbi:MAG: ExeA family protein [Aeromonadaceae bacterium]
MYLAHFGLRAAPFGLTPNTEFYFGLPPHEEALQVLRVALSQGEGFIKVTGEVGTGKTLLLRKLMDELGTEHQVAYLPNPYLTPEELRQALALELGIEMSAQELVVTDAIQRRLIALRQAGRPVVLLLDEAQAIPDATLEAIRLFGNLETESSKLLQVVLFGQPELDRRLAAPGLRQLRQRITFSYRLRPLLLDETRAYLEYRLQVSGYLGAPLFSPRALVRLWRAGRGIPRLINILAHKSLMLAYGRGERWVRPRHVSMAMADTDDVMAPRQYGWWLIGLLLAILLLVWQLWQTRGMV